MAVRIEEYVLKGREFIGQVATALQKPDDIDHANQVTVSVLHALRNLLTPEESLHLIAQLPLYIKAAYVDGWHYDEEKKSKSRRTIPPQEVEAVFSVLEKYVGVGEMQHVVAQLPAEMKLDAEFQKPKN